jgi:hypothetical protein
MFQTANILNVNGGFIYLLALEKSFSQDVYIRLMVVLVE